MVSTTTLRPRSAARSASAAEVVVLPTPPEPQHTMIPVSGSSSSASTSSAGRCRWRPAGRRGACWSCHPLLAQQLRPARRAAEVDAAGEPGQLVGRHVRAPATSVALRVLELRAARRGRGPRRAAPSTSVGVDVDLARLEVGGDRVAVERRRRAPRASSSAPRSCGRTRLTTTPPTGRPAARSSAIPSAVSCTGISSSTVTRWTAVRGERNSAITVSACDLIGPTLASPASSLLTPRNWAIRPVGGASSTTASY